jgi:hypothetical protein
MWKIIQKINILRYVLMEMSVIPYFLLFYMLICSRRENKNGGIFMVQTYLLINNTTCNIC